WGMALGLAMPLLALGLPLSLSGAPANLLAVPWIELLVVPPALAGSLLLWVPLAFRWTCCFVRLACWRAWPRPGSHPPQRPGA
ncbi:ComEC/Rec2 family competence protein, partial [Pseudomonas aeruginosa]|uniref:ComEC/Rec2 family competence protein n=1 Tax=Pseudomonas aeruginosa TaxID=287 RepID=UPI001EE6CBFF